MATTDRDEQTGGAAEWRRRYESTPEREGELFSTISGVENQPLYSPENVEVDYERDLGPPGMHPFTRGVYPSMYRGRLWTMRQFAGFGTAEETNERFRYLLAQGQTGILKEYIAQKEWIFPPLPSMRLVVDMIEWCAAELPLMHPVSISGYHIREAGSTAAQELAFTLSDGFAYVEACVERGLDVDDFAPRLSFFFNAHLDFFEEIAKYRAARRIWAHELREQYGARNPRSWLMRFHTQTAGVSLTAQQPEVNIIRTALEALAAVLGGTQSLHTNSFDEALALPTENAVRLALRTQQVIAHETGVGNTIDALGGSYYVEDLTNRLEAEAHDYFDRIRKLGGVIPAIKENFFQREIADASFRYQPEVEQRQRIVVGVNRYVHADEQPLEILRIDPALEGKQIGRVQALRARRDSAQVESALGRLKEDASHEDRNLMRPIVEASKGYGTPGWR